MCSNRTTQIPVLLCDSPPLRGSPNKQLRAAQSRGMTSLQFAETANIPGEHGTLSKHSHTPGLISLFLPTLLLPAGSNPCSQKAKNPAASISAAASQSLFIINFIKGLGSPSPFHVPDSGEIMTVIIAKAPSTGISSHWYVQCMQVCMCVYVFVCMRETYSSVHQEATDNE